MRRGGRRQTNNGVDIVAPKSVVFNACVDGPKESGIFFSCESVDGYVRKLNKILLSMF